ncbi:MAG: TlpA disulfide reductase family protein [Pirellulales bacterium]
MKLSGDGRLMIHGVPAGEYDLVVQLYEEPAGCLVETIGENVVPVTVTQAEADNGAIEIGDIEVECRTGPRAGSDMRAFKFTDAHGQVRHVDDLARKFVLLHAWATWCRPCLESMPAIKSTVMRYSDAPLTVVGLNVDDDPAVARAMAQAEGWDWAQNYLGNDSAMMRQLAVSTIPAYYLIGPDGKLVGSSNHWEQIQQLLRTELDNFVAISP